MVQKHVLTAREFLVILVKGMWKDFWTRKTMRRLAEGWLVTALFAVLFMGTVVVLGQFSVATQWWIDISLILSTVIGIIYMIRSQTPRLAEQTIPSTVYAERTRPYCGCRRVECPHCNDDEW